MITICKRREIYIMKKWFQTILIMSFGVILWACGQSEDGVTTDPVRETENDFQIVTTFYPMYEFTKQIVGDLAQVELMIPNEGKVHGYEPSAKDVADIQASDLFIYANPEMETWVPSVIESINTEEVVFVEADENIELLENEPSAEEEHTEEEHTEEEHDHAVDPHTWLDPTVAIQQVEQIRDAVIAEDPDNKATYIENAEAFIQELKALDEEFQVAFAGAEQRTFITQHEAFGYLAHRYDLDQRSLAGISDQSESNPQKMAEAVNMIADLKLPVVYYNSQSNHKLADTVATEADVNVAVLYSLESVTAEDQDAGENYVSLMKKNIESLKLSIQ